MAAIHTSDVAAQAKDDLNAKALLVLEIYEAVKARFGEKTAIELLETAHLNFGKRMGRSKSISGGKSADALAKFVSTQNPAFVVSTERAREATTICFKECPYLDAWRTAGVSNSDVSNLCKIASGTDRGILELAGISVQIATWQPGDQHCCLITAATQS